MVFPILAGGEWTSAHMHVGSIGKLIEFEESRQSSAAATAWH
jgi:hypothetical protein